MRESGRDLRVADFIRDEIAQTLTMIGLEVEGIEDRGEALRPFIVAHVVSAEPHPAGVRIMVGGYPFMVDPALCSAVGADGTASDAEAAVALAAQWRAEKSPAA